MTIFDERLNVKPYEYPQLIDFIDAINHSYWVHTEFSFESDIQDFATSVTKEEREVIKRSMLAISQIEVSVKLFFTKLYNKMPKPEIAFLGASFAESEVRHSRAYSHLIELLGMNSDFSNIKNIPAIIDRINYLKKYQNIDYRTGNENTMLSILLFCLFIENVSLFSQFLIINSFSKEKNIFKGISNVIDATRAEEVIHSKGGMAIINIIREEFPEWFCEELYNKVHKACLKSYKAENKVLDWIFETTELDFLPRVVVDNFIKDRFNTSLVGVGIPKLFDVDQEVLKNVEWFDLDTNSGKHFDFFYKRPTNYSKFNKPITADQLF